MLDYDYFDVICHLDLIKKFGRTASRSFDKELNQILSKIRARNLAVEVNTSGYNHPVQEPYPSPDIIAKCFEEGINITLGSDAHHPAEVGQHYERILPVLQAAGYRHITTFTKRQGSPVAIENPDETLLITAAQNPDGSIAVVILNMNSERKTYS